MNRTMIAVFTAVMRMSSLTVAQGRGNHGKPAATGIEHAEQVAKPKVVSKGIDTAEAKQAQQKTKKSIKSKKNAKARAKHGSR